LVLSSRKTTIKDVAFLEFESISNLNGILTIYQNFRIERVFTVAVDGPVERGNHAHLKCTQLILVKLGKVLFEISDGINSMKIILTSSDGFLRIPPGLWSVQKYLEKSEIIVLCDYIYDEKEYIRDWNTFVKHKSA
jgi:hypothetical protein